MGSTNSTVNYALSQFIGTDKPSWLNDYDNDMFKIDAQMKLNATAAASAKTTADTADGKADANALAISTLDSQINTAGTGLAANVAANTTAIGTINGEIGNTPLTTVAQTLTGAIEEVKDSIPSTTNVMKLIDVTDISVSYDGVKTISAVLDELFAALQTHLASKGNDYKFQFGSIVITPSYAPHDYIQRIFSKTFNSSIYCSVCELPYLYQATIKSSGSTFKYIDLTGNTVSDQSSSVPTTGAAHIYINEFTIM